MLNTEHLLPPLSHTSSLSTSPHPYPPSPPSHLTPPSPRCLALPSPPRAPSKVLASLKAYQGINFVRAMETMFLDLVASETSQQSFAPVWSTKQARMDETDPAKDLLKFQVIVLTRTAWPPNLVNMQVNNN